MIIISQDKKSIYNFKNCKSIDIIENSIYISDDVLANEGAMIAEYKSEERAKEVLDELIMMYENLKTPTYRMPKE